MAASGGHWVKATSGPYSGKLNFVPASKETTWVSKNGISHAAVESGGLTAIQTASGWQVYQKLPDGSLGEYPIGGTYASKQLAKGKMQNMNAQGFAKSVQEPDGGYNSVKIGSTTGALVKPGSAVHQAFNPGAKTTGAAKPPKVNEPGAKTVKGETAAAQAQAAAGTGKYGMVAANTGAPLATHADFLNNAHEVQITTIMGNTEKVNGVLLNDGSLGVTYNAKTGQFHVVDAVSGKTISKYGSAEEAFAGAKVESKNMVSIQAPANKDFPAFTSASAGDKAFATHYAGHKMPSAYKETVGSFQANSGYANDYVWHGKENDFVYSMDKAIASVPGLPKNMQLIRGESQGHPLYSLAKSLSVGEKYHAKGFDCTSHNPNHEWGGNAVKLVYRAPKGLPAVFGYHFTGKYHSEHEVSLARNLRWNVIGKTVHGGNITLTLEFDGFDG